MKDKNKALTEEVASLQSLRSDLLDEVKQLQTEYQTALASNDSLATVNAETTAMVAAKSAQISKIKKSTSQDAKGMLSEIEQLRSIKKDLTAVVGKLNKQVGILTAANRNLQQQVGDANARNQELAFEISQLKAMNLSTNQELKKVAASSTRANNFRIDIRKKETNQPAAANEQRKLN